MEHKKLCINIVCGFNYNQDCKKINFDTKYINDSDSPTSENMNCPQNSSEIKMNTVFQLRNYILDFKSQHLQKNFVCLHKIRHYVFSSINLKFVRNVFVGQAV